MEKEGEREEKGEGGGGRESMCDFLSAKLCRSYHVQCQLL